MPDIAIITETWCKENLPILNMNFSVFQAKNEGSKGIEILVNKELQGKEERWDEFDGWLKLISIGQKKYENFHFWCLYS